MSQTKKLIFSILLSVLIISLDLITKFYAKENINLLIPGMEIVKGLNFVYVENKGISFGIFSNLNISFFLGIISFLISVYILYLIYYSNEKLEVFSLSLILGGAVGNGYERLTQEFVVDFIDIYYVNFHWPAFNLADAFITIGAIFFLYSIIKTR
ncbi:MAG: Lipoprotein signal peptidase [Alphaproteobacteria bacterium MarineAlpha8_Bin1]|nr:MAG: Lipoprotein signal peptidase [Alphaproteobacteria bacterium MarineAlpha8_Bin1]|tara:strand:+ start:947 stop:1411 length:465 start_codon:yes stop_codon:yes gene_type:complete